MSLSRFPVTRVSSALLLSPLRAARYLSTSSGGQYSLPPLPYDYGALEPAISGQIMETHHKKHHQTYVNNLNAAVAQLQEAQHNKQDATQLVQLQSAINFNGGGHINHSIFWTNLAPKQQGGGTAHSQPHSHTDRQTDRGTERLCPFLLPVLLASSTHSPQTGKRTEAVAA